MIKSGIDQDALVEMFAQDVEEAKKNDCDLIVMGTHVSRLTMGSEAELVVRSSPVPVLLLRREEPRA